MFVSLKKVRQLFGAVLHTIVFIVLLWWCQHRPTAWTYNLLQL